MLEHVRLKSDDGDLRATEVGTPPKEAPPLLLLDDHETAEDALQVFVLVLPNP